MGQVLQIEEGTATLGVYRVVYDEDLFLRYTESEQQWCYAQWLKKALPLDCKRLVVQLVPDALFPRDPAKPYIYVYHQQDIVRADRVGFKCHGEVRVLLDDGITDIDVPLRHKIETALLQYPNGTTYKVYCQMPGTHKTYKTLLLEGKVNK